MAETRDVLKELRKGFNKVTFENTNTNVSLTLDNVVLEDFGSAITIAPPYGSLYCPMTEEIRITLRRIT